MDIGSFGGRTPPTRTRIGRLKYDTRATAQRKADSLGLDGTHSHKMKGMNGGERFYMPGENHKKLNKALKKRGMRPTPARENGMGMGGSGGGRDRPGAFDQLRDDRDDDRDRRGTGLGDLAAGAAGLGLGLGALGALTDDEDGGGEGGDGGGGLYE
jgi:hypothetical protein